MKQADLKRAQQTLRTARMRLAEERLLFERQQRKADEGRQALVDELARARHDLARLEAELARANERAARAVARQQAAEHALSTRREPLRDAPRAAYAPAPPPPQPLRPTPVPATEHRAIPVRAELRGETGWRATCTCGWRSSFERSEGTAVQMGSVHLDRMTGPSRRRERGAL